MLNAIPSEYATHSDTYRQALKPIDAIDDVAHIELPPMVIPP
jgi:hypothetical protein